MKIVVLDGHVASGDDLGWDALSALGDLTVYDRTTPDQIAERAADAEAVFVNKVVLDAAVLDSLPALRFVGVLATGFNNVDVVAARRRGIVVCNVPAYSTNSVVQTIFALLLTITNRVELHSDSVHSGDWVNCLDFSYRLTPLPELSGATMGIYGLGHIGSSVANIARAFGMKVIALTSKVPWQLPAYIQPVEREELLRESDVLVLCAPLTAQNKYFINTEALSMMKPSAILINTARGGLVDSYALAKALEENRLYAAGIDVMESEPPRADDPLLTAPRCFITPHYAWQGEKARRELLRISADNLAAYIAGRPVNVVN